MRRWPAKGPLLRLLEAIEMAAVSKRLNQISSVVPNAPYAIVKLVSATAVFAQSSSSLLVIFIVIFLSDTTKVWQC